MSKTFKCALLHKIIFDKKKNRLQIKMKFKPKESKNMQNIFKNLMENRKKYHASSTAEQIPGIFI